MRDLQKCQSRSLMNSVTTSRIQEERKVRSWTSKQVFLLLLRNNHSCLCFSAWCAHGSRFKSIYGPLHFFINCEESYWNQWTEARNYRRRSSWLSILVGLAFSTSSTLWTKTWKRTFSCSSFSYYGESYQLLQEIRTFHGSHAFRSWRRWTSSLLH